MLWNDTESQTNVTYDKKDTIINVLQYSMNFEYKQNWTQNKNNTY